MDKSLSVQSLSESKSQQLSGVSLNDIDDQIGFVTCLSETEAIAISLKCQFYYFNSETDTSTHLKVNNSEEGLPDNIV